MSHKTCLITIDIVVANAFIDLLRVKKPAIISFSTLTNYGNEIITYLKKNFKINALIMENDSDDLPIVQDPDFTRYFHVVDSNIIINEDITLATLTRRFRDNLRYEILKAFISKEAKKVLFAD